MMNFLGFLNFHAPYMPFVLLGFSFAISGTLPKSDAIGIMVGHIYYYFVDVYPRTHGGRTPLRTPKILQRIFGQDADEEITLRQALLPRIHVEAPGPEEEQHDNNHED